MASASKAVYARISDDTDASGLGVERQLQDGLRLCESRGWVPIKYADNDLSAFKRKVVRPQFEQMLVDLRAQKVSGVVVYNLDRLARQPRDLERLIDLYDDFPDLTFATVEGDINLATGDGRTMARVMVAFANKASLDTGRRTKRKHLELAQSGEPVGRRTFGWQTDKRTLDPIEAAHAREVVENLLAGVGIRELARRLNEAGALTTVGGAWSHQSLRKYLLNPRLVGLRTYNGKVMLNEDGSPVRGTWEPMLDQDTFDRLQLHLVVSPSSTGQLARRGARKYLLTGLLRCGVCHGLMFGSKAREAGRFNYVCDSSAAADRHTVSVSGHPVNRLIEAVVLARLSMEVLEPTTEIAWAGEQRLSAIDQQITTLMDAFLAGTLSEQTVFPRVEALEAERAALRRDRSSWLIETTGPTVHSETPESWASKSTDEQRAIMDKLLVAIYVRPATQRQRLLDPARIVPVWQGDQPAPDALPQ